jgi:hypothetical protein
MPAFEMLIIGQELKRVEANRNVSKRSVCDGVLNMYSQFRFVVHLRT